ncbi:MAG: hypothetical protein HYY77_05285, partial [Betaproteobacteria bacterium]|nr:hypothetical protein [Betaproteobacteria bacterium]
GGEAQRVKLAAELVDALKDSGVASPAMLFEATRESQYAMLYQDVAGETLTAAEDVESAQADWAGAFIQLELVCVQSEYQRLTASGARNDAERKRFQELSRRLAELKGAAGNGARTPI